MRSDWTADATYALFRCGRYGEIDGAWGRNNADNLHFIINKRGILAADTGAVHSLNNAALALPARRSTATPAAHPGVCPPDHRPQLDHRGQRAAGAARLERRLAGDRTQRRPIADPGQDVVEAVGTVRAQGRRPAVPGGADRRLRNVALFDYAAGDATHSYPPTRVKSITRQFVYLRPDTFVVFDRVANAAGWPGDEMAAAHAVRAAVRRRKKARSVAVTGGATRRHPGRERNRPQSPARRPFPAHRAAAFTLTTSGRA